jgi:hypothetical protein
MITVPGSVSAKVKGQSEDESSISCSYSPLFQGIPHPKGCRVSPVNRPGRIRRQDTSSFVAGPCGGAQRVVGGEPQVLTELRRHRVLGIDRGETKMCLFRACNCQGRVRVSC